MDNKIRMEEVRRILETVVGGSPLVYANPENENQMRAMIGGRTIVGGQAFTLMPVPGDLEPKHIADLFLRLIHMSDRVSAEAKASIAKHFKWDELYPRLDAVSTED